MRKLTTFYIVRHGRTQWNVEHKMQGHMDSPLTEEGLEQARELARQFVDVHFDAAFASDLLRAKRTAEIISADKKIAVQTTKLLRETSFGRYEGMVWEKFESELRDMIDEREALELASFLKFKISPEVETYEEISTRFITFLRETAIAFEGKTILVVSHSGMMQGLLMRLGYATHKTLPVGRIKNLAHIILESDGTDFFVKSTEGIEISSSSASPAGL